MAGGLLSYSIKLPIHIIELIVIHVILGISAYMLFDNSAPRTRATTMGLGFSAKSLIFIFYQLGTTYVKRLQRWKSVKAYTILNGMDIVFWAALCYMVAQANVNSCVGISCTLRWVIFGCGLALALFSVWAFFICFVHFRELRARQRDEESQVPVSQVQHGYGGQSMRMEDRHWTPSDSSVEHVRK